MAAISSGQLIARPLSLRTRAAAFSALSLAGLPAGTGDAAWAGSLAAAGRADALCPDGAILAVFWGERLGEAFFLAVMMLLPGTRLGTGQCACRAAPSGSAQLPRRGHRFKAIPREFCFFQQVRHVPQRLAQGRSPRGGRKAGIYLWALVSAQEPREVGAAVLERDQFSIDDRASRQAAKHGQLGVAGGIVCARTPPQPPPCEGSGRARLRSAVR